MSRKITRRSITVAAWTVPVMAACAPVPAFAASALICAPTAECKLPGEGSNTKDYAIRTNCASTGGAITAVDVYDDKQGTWIPATPNPDGTWTSQGFNDSRRDRSVRITDASGQVDVTRIPFPPC